MLAAEIVTCLFHMPLWVDWVPFGEWKVAFITGKLTATRLQTNPTNHEEGETTYEVVVYDINVKVLD